MDWYLNPALSVMRAEVNAVYPARDRASDGTIGDPAHAARASDHNPDPDGSVDAWDMDVELAGAGRPHAGLVERVKRCFEAHPCSAYWIHNDEISFRSEGWRPRSYAYAGPSRNRHDHHVHWNTRSSHEGVITPFGIGEDSMELADTVTLRTGGEVEYSSKTSTVEGVLTSTNYYVLLVRNRIAALSAAVAGLQTTAAAQAAAIEKLVELATSGAGLDAGAIIAAIRTHIDLKVAELPDATADAVVAEIAS